MECVLRNIKNDYYYKNEWLSKNANQVKIINLGSSHGYYGINPKYFDQLAFNVAHVSQSLDYDYMIINKFVKNMDSLKVVILPISYFTMSSKLSKGDEKFRAVNYVIEYGFSGHNLKEKFRLCNLTAQNNIKKVIAYMLLNKDDVICDKNGFYWNENRAITNKNNEYLSYGAKRAEYHHSRDQHGNIFMENMDNVNKIISLCSANNVLLVILTTPTWYTYRENLHQEQLSEMTHFCDSIAAAHYNVIYLNMIEDSRFEDKDFYDSDHLSLKGANKLTKILNDTIDKSNHPFLTQ